MARKNIFPEVEEDTAGWEQAAIDRLYQLLAVHKSNGIEKLEGQVYADNVYTMSKDHFLLAQRMTALKFLELRFIPNPHFVFTRYADTYIQFNLL